VCDSEDRLNSLPEYTGRESDGFMRQSRRVLSVNKAEEAGRARPLAFTPRHDMTSRINSPERRRTYRLRLGNKPALPAFRPKIYAP
jgi:hypothetical protein